MVRSATTADGNEQSADNQQMMSSRQNSVRHFRDVIRGVDKIRYLAWRVAGIPESITVHLTNGRIITMRHPPASDVGVAWEVFGVQSYRSPRRLDRESIRSIVDVGANVGYTAIYLGFAFPLARIVAFEPHPEQVRLMRLNLAANELQCRVTVVDSAVATTDGMAYLTDSCGTSRIMLSPGPNCMPVHVLNFFDAVGGQRIDLLKMDCEGGEYPLLMSARFPELDIRTLVLEWHASPERPNAYGEICTRLRSLGWSLEAYQVPSCPVGIIWAYKPALSSSEPNCDA